MGGTGSGRWGWHQRKTTVEDSRLLNLGVILRRGAPVPGQTGTLTWSRNGEATASVGYRVVARTDGGLAIRLSYTWSLRLSPETTERAVNLDIRLEPGRVPRGGRRWWGRCPLVVSGVPCGRRVGKLYLPPGSPYFGCRYCHRLSYRSRQEHDPRVTRLLRNPDALTRLTTDLSRCSIPELGLLLKALTAQQAHDERGFRRFKAKYGRSDD